MYDISGNGAKKRLAKRRLNYVDANINSYSCLLNLDKRLKDIKEANELAAVLAEISNDREKQKEQSKKKKAREEAKQEEGKVGRGRREATKGIARSERLSQKYI